MHETSQTPRAKGQGSAVKELLRRKGENKQNTSISRDLGFGRCWRPSSHWRTGKNAPWTAHQSVHSHSRSRGSIQFNVFEGEKSPVPSGTTGSPSVREVAPRKGWKGNITFGTAPVTNSYPNTRVQDGRWPAMLTLANTVAKMQTQLLWN